MSFDLVFGGEPAKPQQNFDEVYEPPKAATIGLFDIIKSANYTKRDLWAEFGDEVMDKCYSPFQINRGLSFGADTIFAAAELNKYPMMPKHIQYELLKGIIRQRQRFDKWIKAEEKDEEFRAVQECYGYNDDQTRYAMRVLTKEQRANIIAHMSSREGGGGVATKAKRTTKAKAKK